VSILQLEAMLPPLVEAIYRVYPLLKNRFKLHALLHFPAYIRRFGPPRHWDNEVYESMNKTTRSYIVHSNNKDDGRTAVKQWSRRTFSLSLLHGGYYRRSDTNGLVLVPGDNIKALQDHAAFVGCLET
jgi:hypothetical protein